MKKSENLKETNCNDQNIKVILLFEETPRDLFAKESARLSYIYLAQKSLLGY